MKYSAKVIRYVIIIILLSVIGIQQYRISELTEESRKDRNDVQQLSDNIREIDSLFESSDDWSEVRDEVNSMKSELSY
ncbi:MAG: hypothetical protein PHW64_04460 [Sulfuricurvum sp.]|nr:hypothetical protein [Sulfuricurvum sp.]